MESEESITQICLSPVLFKYYLNDILKTEKTEIALFADDTEIYVHSTHSRITAKKSQTQLDKL